MEEGGFDLFSDIDSRIGHLRRILFLIGLLGALELYVGVFNVLLPYFRGGSAVRLVPGILAALVGVWMAYGFARIDRKIGRLKKERILHE